MPELERRIGTLVSGLREEQGLTTTVLAERVGISQAQISRLENGRQGFRSGTLVKIAHALGVRPVYFFLNHKAGSASLDELPGKALKAPGRLGEALEHVEFMGLAEEAAAIYLDKREFFKAIEQAIDSAHER